MARFEVVRPVAGKRIRNHQEGYRLLAPEGEQVAWDPSWTKRLAEGGIEIVKPEPEPTPIPATPKAKAVAAPATENKN